MGRFALLIAASGLPLLMLLAPAYGEEAEESKEDVEARRAGKGRLDAGLCTRCGGVCHDATIHYR